MKNQIWIPTVIEKTGRGERAYDIYSRLLEDRIVFIGSEINDAVANSIMAQLLFLDRTNKNQDINVYVNSPGGSVTAGLAIYDTMQFVTPDVATYCLGQAASMGVGSRSVRGTAGVVVPRRASGPSGFLLCSSWRIELQISMHSSQM